MGRPKNQSDTAWEEYLRAIADHSGGTATNRERELLLSYAELQFRLHGGGHCSLCGVHVRHVLPVTIERNGDTIQHCCLCTRCLEAERATATKLTLRVGNAAIEYAGRGTPTHAK
jgi:hypothetical protein